MSWNFWLLVLHVLSDLLIAAAYFSIPVALVMFVRRRTDIRFGVLFWMFSLFIFSCGITHILAVYVLWYPDYWMEGWGKMITAAVSVTTAIMLWKILPEALSIPTPQQFTRAKADLAAQEKLRVEAEQSNILKDNFLATLGHELRTPLNAILGWTQLMKMGAMPGDKTTEAIAVIERNAGAQARLINDLLDLSAITAGKMQIEMATVDVRDVLDTAVKTILPAALTRKIEVTHQYADGPQFVEGDKERLQQVVTNILGNSLKFTPEGGHVDVRLESAGSFIIISVKDDGAGISREFLPYIFDRFSQADNSPTRIKGGLGIGLALAKQLVKLHDGSILAQSEGKGKGVTITIELPRSKGEGIKPVGPPPGEATSLAGFSLLVVEDDPDSRTLCEEILRTAGAEVVGVASAAEALADIARRRPSAIVSDIAMPEKDGLWFMRQVRELPGCDAAALPAIAVSAMARDTDRDAALAAGFQGYLTKPVQAHALLQALSALLAAKP